MRNFSGGPRSFRWLKSSLNLVGVVFAWVLSSAPAVAQEDPSGGWVVHVSQDADDRIAGPGLGAYMGLPINAAARQKADAFNPGILELAEVRCQPHVSDYVWRAPFNLRIWRDIARDTQQVTAYHVYFQYMEAQMDIFMDGRPHPPAYARHTWAGFSTGKWDGNDLVVKTTHLKEGWLNITHMPRSDQATVSTHIMRHVKYLTVTVIQYDPIYLTEPLVRTMDFVLDPRLEIAPFVCDPANTLSIPEGTIPHYGLRQNPYIYQYADQHGIPHQATRGGAETMYPEYLQKMTTMPRPAKTESPQRRN